MFSELFYSLYTYRYYFGVALLIGGMVMLMWSLPHLSYYYRKGAELKAVYTLQRKLLDDYEEFLRDKGSTVQACYNLHAYDPDETLENAVASCLRGAYSFPYAVSLTALEQEVYNKYCTLEWERFSPVLICNPH